MPRMGKYSVTVASVVTLGAPLGVESGEMAPILGKTAS